jgi:3alpha(or 20beta)-hydroxysteroid dehydrogenase
VAAKGVVDVGRLSGKVAIVTGGARGQGAAEARLFASEGAKVVIGDVLDEEGRLVAKDIGSAAVYHHHDVTAESEWAEIVRLAVDTFGGLDVLVNNAGIFRMAPIQSTSVDAYMEIIKINQLGTFLGMKAVAPAMTRGGSIVNISSIAGLRGSPGSVAYSASKWAVRGMTKVAALEYAPLGIRVNSIHPGVIDTPMLADLLITDEAAKAAFGARVPVGQVAQAEQVARLALFLASDESDHSTGSEFVVDGGITAGMGFRG